jgi:hypothetical protein
MGKNNQKKEKALRNLENARKYKKRPPSRFGGPRRSPAGAAAGPATAAGPGRQPSAPAGEAPASESSED